MASKRKKAVNRADKYFSLYIRERDKQCVTCGATDNLQCGHLITRSKQAVRWDEKNAFAQCPGCNLRHEHQPEIFTRRWLQKYSEAEYHALVRESNIPKKYSTEEVEEIADYYKRKWEELCES